MSSSSSFKKKLLFSPFFSNVFILVRLYT
jgi:hypothetical protein